MSSALAFSEILLVIAFGAVALQFWARLRQLNVVAESAFPLPDESRYRPMLRLLDEEEVSFVTGTAADLKKFRVRRGSLFRAYLRCLTRDYARLLANVRLAMVRSSVDRPELAKALASARFRFCVSLCRIEVSLFLYTAGFGRVDVSGLVEALEVLRAQASFSNATLARIPA